MSVNFLINSKNRAYFDFGIFGHLRAIKKAKTPKKRWKPSKTFALSQRI